MRDKRDREKERETGERKGDLTEKRTPELEPREQADWGIDH